jgi:S-adenosylmethionine:tRNA ribosyltransferase-isomerase
MTLAVRPRTQFHRPPGSDAFEPPEAHGVARDAVRLLVARPGGVSHARFADLGDYLRPGDLLVVNNSATMPAAVDGRRGGQAIAVHFATARADKEWVVELRPAVDAAGHLTDVRPGERIDMPGGAGHRVVVPRTRGGRCAAVDRAGSDRG